LALDAGNESCNQAGWVFQIEHILIQQRSLTNTLDGVSAVNAAYYPITEIVALNADKMNNVFRLESGSIAPSKGRIAAAIPFVAERAPSACSNRQSWLSRFGYVQGVSTRSVDDLVRAMGMTGISKSQVSRLCADPTGDSPMATAKPLARQGAIWGRASRAASLPPSYTTSWDTTYQKAKDVGSLHKVVTKRYEVQL
jgi:hypothetical protein